MVTLHLTARVQVDGTQELKTPTPLPEGEVEVTLLIQSLHVSAPSDLLATLTACRIGVRRWELLAGASCCVAYLSQQEVTDDGRADPSP